MSLRIVYKIRRRQSLPIYGHQLDRRDGVVARAHALSGWSGIQFLRQVIPIDLKNGIYRFLAGVQHYRNSVESKPARYLVVSLG